MTTSTLILVKLNRVLSSIANNDKTAAFSTLIDMVNAIFPCDAAVLLKGSGESLVVAAQQGLKESSQAKQFLVNEHPRLKQIIDGTDWLRFDADSPLPDPYDNMIESVDGALPIHDCMGTPLYSIDGVRWGVLTFDTLTPHAFDNLDPNLLKVVTELASLCLSIETNIDTLSKIRESNQNKTPDLIGQSPTILRLRESISAVAPTELNVLIQGESGTGKELIAQQIHHQSQLNNAAFVTLNCATLPKELAESELFGHEKGAFTGADKAKRGKFELADNGTLFLDEIGELPLDLQAKLLRALQQGEIQRLGSESSIRVNCRIIAATNRDLKLEVENGRFREDLYHRLNVFPILSPALRDRTGDIPLLLNFFTEQWIHKVGARSAQYSDIAVQLFEQYSWPGNVRELEHMVAHILVTEKSRTKDNEKLSIDRDSVPITPSSQRTTSHVAVETAQDTEDLSEKSLQELTQQFQRELIQQALEKTNQNWAQAAKLLNVDRANLSRLAKRLGMK